MDSDLAALREEYSLAGLVESDLAPDPLAMFQRWFDAARHGGVHEPNAMVLATVNTQGQPTARNVLLKELSSDGFVFFTNRESSKGQDLADNPACSLVFSWLDLQRQVRVEGEAVPTSRDVDEEYFASRPRASQLGAWASAGEFVQSQSVPSRDALDAAYQRLETEYADQQVPCPPHWGGYTVFPTAVEFWQGRVGRLHDRLRYRRSDGPWWVERLAP